MLILHRSYLHSALCFVISLHFCSPIVSTVFDFNLSSDFELTSSTFLATFYWMLDDPVNASIVVLHDCVTSHALLRGSSKDRKILFGREKSTKSVGVIATGLHNGFVARVFLLAAIATIYNISRCLINAKTRGVPLALKRLYLSS